jgi:hypothetical protein
MSRFVGSMMIAVGSRDLPYMVPSRTRACPRAPWCRTHTPKKWGGDSFLCQEIDEETRRQRISDQNESGEARYMR